MVNPHLSASARGNGDDKEERNLFHELIEGVA
jgi:hypothetical protein